MRRDAIVCKHCGRDIPCDEQENELQEFPGTGRGTYRGHEYVRRYNGNLDLRLSSGKWKTFAAENDLKAYVDAITGSASGRHRQ